MGGKRVLMLSNWIDSSDLSKPYYIPQNESLKDTWIFFNFLVDDAMAWSKSELMNTNPIKGGNCDEGQSHHRQKPAECNNMEPHFKGRGGRLVRIIM